MASKESLESVVKHPWIFLFPPVYNILFFEGLQSHSYWFAFSFIVMQVSGYHVPSGGQPILVKDGLVVSNFKVVPSVWENWLNWS